MNRCIVFRQSNIFDLPFRRNDITAENGTVAHKKGHISDSYTTIIIKINFASSFLSADIGPNVSKAEVRDI